MQGHTEVMQVDKTDNMPGMHIEAQIKPHTTSCSNYSFGGPKEGCFSILRNASLTIQGSSDISKTVYSQICGPETHIAKGIPAGASQIAHHLCHVFAQNLALQFAQLPSTVFVCKVGSFGSMKCSL